MFRNLYNLAQSSFLGLSPLSLQYQAFSNISVSKLFHQMKSWAKKTVSSNDKNITAWAETDVMVQQQHATRGALWLLRRG